MTVSALVLLIVYSAIVSTWKVFHFLLLLYKPRRFFLSASARRFIDRQGPLVSILLAARDEEEQIGSCIRSVLASDYKRFELIVVNDRSTDRTMAEAVKAAHGDPRVSVIRVDDCPGGWTGKMNAIHHAYSRAHGDVILVMDADSRHSPATLGAALASQQDNKLEMVSLMPRIRHRTFLSRLVQPLIGAVIFCWKPLPWVNSRKYRHVAFAWGGFLLLRRRSLEAIGGFEAVRDRFAADIAIASRLKAQGRRIRLYHAPELVSTTMYASGRSMTAGWSRILRITANHRPGYLIATLLAIAVFGLSAYVTVGVGLAECLRGSARPLPLWFGAMGSMHVACQVLLLARVYRMGGSNPIFALGHLPAMLFTSFLTLLALFHCRTPRLSWRGTAYALTRDGRVAPGATAWTAQFNASGLASCEAGAGPAVLTPAGH